MNTIKHIAVIGAGLAGSEAALQLANAGVAVTLFEMKPEKRSPAHHSLDFAEIVCSNSFGSQGSHSASGLIKQEMALLDCQLLSIAKAVAVPAGQALAVDREIFSKRVTETIHNHPNITVRAKEVTELPTGFDAVIIATGPLTSPGLAETLAKLTQRERLFFFDAASPILVRDTIDMDIAFVQDRYGKSGEDGGAESYINCPLNKAEYEALVEFILAAEKTELKDFEKDTNFFESCLPVEVMASRGHETLRYGPMKPVGLTNPHTGEQPYAVVQLRQDNADGTLVNMVGFQTNVKWGPQREMIAMIPGLANAEVVRLGVMHRNTYLHSPELLTPTLQLRAQPNVLIAGQLTGTEGYTESIATGMIAAQNALAVIHNETPQPLPTDTMLGALLAYITRPEAVGKAFQPINSNWGILPPLPPDAMLNEWGKRIKDKRLRNEKYVARALAAMAAVAKPKAVAV